MNQSLLDLANPLPAIEILLKDNHHAEAALRLSHCGRSFIVQQFAARMTGVRTTLRLLYVQPEGFELGRRAAAFVTLQGGHCVKTSEGCEDEIAFSFGLLRR